MTREEMFNEVIHKFGFENPYTIMFAECVENQDEKLENIFESLINKNIEEENQGGSPSFLFAVRQGSRRTAKQNCPHIMKI